MEDMKSHVSVAQTLAPQTLNASAAGTGADLAGCNKAGILINVGTISGSATATCVLEESSDNSSFSTVGAGYYQGTNPLVINSANDAGAHFVGYLGSQRYIRGSVASVTNTPALPTSIAVVREGAIKQPTT